MPAGIMVNSVADTVAIILEILDKAEREIDFLAPSAFLSLAGTLDTLQSAERFIGNGGAVRGITAISLANVEEARKRLAINEDLRHCDPLSEIFMFVGDKQYSISSMNIGSREYALDTHVVAFWSESPVYAEYLLSSFENVWSTAVPAEERIQELLEQGLLKG